MDHYKVTLHLNKFFLLEMNGYLPKRRDAKNDLEIAAADVLESVEAAYSKLKTVKGRKVGNETITFTSDFIDYLKANPFVIPEQRDFFFEAVEEKEREERENEDFFLGTMKEMEEEDRL